MYSGWLSGRKRASVPRTLLAAVLAVGRYWRLIGDVGATSTNLRLRLPYLLSAAPAAASHHHRRGGHLPPQPGTSADLADISGSYQRTTRTMATSLTPVAVCIVRIDRQGPPGRRHRQRAHPPRLTWPAPIALGPVGAGLAIPEAKRGLGMRKGSACKRPANARRR